MGQGPMSAGQRNDSGKTVASLGCGTLIVIALIVLLFSRQDLDPIKEDLDALRRETAELRSEVEMSRRLLELIAAEQVPATALEPVSPAPESVPEPPAGG